MNTTGSAVHQVLPVGAGQATLDLPAGPFLRVTGTGVTVVVAGQTLTGDVTVEKSGTAVHLTAANVRLLLGDGARAIVRLSDGAADLTFDGTKVVGTASGTVALLNVPDVTLSGTLGAAFDSSATGSNPKVVVTGTDVVLAVSALRLSAARIRFSQSAGEVAVTLTDGELVLADGSGRAIARATDLDGTIRMASRRVGDTTSGGVYGAIVGAVSLDVPNVSFASKLQVSFNTTAASKSVAVVTAVASDGTETTVTQTVPQGVQLTATGATLVVGGQVIGGDVTITSEPVTGGRRVRIAVEHLTLRLGPVASPIVDVTTADSWHGVFVVSPTGMAGRFVGSLGVFHIPNITMSGAVELAVNTGSAAVDANGDGDTADPEDIAAGPYLRIAVGTTAAPAELKVGTAFTLGGVFVVQRSVRPGFGALTLTVTPNETSLATGDVDHDGRTDLLIGTSDSGTYTVQRGGVTPGTAGAPDTIGYTPVTASSTLTLPALTGGARAVALVDVDNDGWLDVVVVGATTRVLRNRGLVATTVGNVTTTAWAGFATTSVALATALATSLATGDVDGDGFADLVIGGSGTGATTQVFLNQRTTSGTWNGYTAGTALGGAKTRAVALVDLDHDGTLDVFVASDGTAAHQVYVNLGLVQATDGTVSWGGFDTTTDRSIAVPAGTDVRGIAVGDLNGDGWADVVAAVDGGAPLTYLNRKAGTTSWQGMAAGVALPGGSVAGRSVAVADVDGDGRLDVVVGTTTATLLYRSTAAGVFGPSKVVGPAAPVALVAANLDTDTDTDLLTVGGTTRALQVVPATSVAIGITNGTASLTPSTGDGAGSGLSLSKVQGAFVLLPNPNGGLAGTISGELTAGVGSFSAQASAAVRFNGTMSAVDEQVVVGDVTIPVVFTDAQKATSATAPYISVSGSGTIKVGDFIEVTGGYSAGALTNGTIFVGQGPLTLTDGTTNPNAHGLLLTNVNGTMSGSAGSYVINATGSFSLIGITGVTFSGTLTVLADEAAHTVTVGASNLTLVVAGLSLTGSFSLVKRTDGTLVLNLGTASGVAGATPVTFAMGDPNPSNGNRRPVTVTISTGTIELHNDGVAASFTSTVHLDAPGLTMADVSGLLQLNTTPGAVTVGGSPIPGGSVRVVLGYATPVEVTVLQQTLRGTFAIEQVTLPVGANAPPGTLPRTVVRIAVSDLELTLGTTTANVHLTHGTGAMVLSNQGAAARFSGTVTVLVPGGLQVIGNTISLALNTTTTAVNEQVDTGNGLVSLVLPAGPYLRFEGTGVQVSFQGQRFSTDIVLESARVGTTDVVRVAFRNATAAFGDGTTTLVALTGGHGLFVLRNEGLAGTLSGHVALNLPSVELSGTFGLTINTASGSGTGFTSTITFGLTPTATTTLLLGDVNGDARPDLLVGTQGQGVIAYLNDGDGDPFDSVSGFTIGGTSTPSGSSSKAVTALALADLDHDGNVDLVVGRTGDTTEVWLGHGDATFTRATGAGVTLLTGALGLATGDLDKNGTVDVLAVATGTATQLYAVGTGSGADWTGLTTSATPATATGKAVALGDVDGDGKLDLVTGGSAGGVGLFLGTGSGFAATDTSLGTAAPTTLLLADVDGDGQLDLVIGTGTPAAGTRTVRHNNGRRTTTMTGATVIGASTLTVVSTAGFAPTGTVTIGSGLGAETVTYTVASATSLTLGTALTKVHAAGESVSTAWLSLATATTMTGPAGGLAVVGDVDADGNPDLVTSTGTGMPMLSLGTDGGGLAPATALASVTLTVPAGAYIAVSGQDVVLSIAGQTLQADVTFTQATAADGTRTVTVALSDGHLQLTGLPEITFTGVLVSTASGVAGSLTLSVANLAIGDATLTGDTGAVFKLLLNSGATAQVVTLPDLSVVRVPAGPYLRIEVSGVLTVGGASISGTFGIEQVTSTGGVKRTVLAVSGASVRLSATGPDLLQNVTGALVVLPTGIAAQVSGSINLAGVLPASVTVQGSFSLSINRTGAAVSETLTLGGTTVSVDVPAGPFVRVAATGVTLSIAGQTLTADVAFQQNGTTSLLLVVKNLTLRLGGDTPVLSITNGSGVLQVTGTTTKVLAGRIAGTVALTVPGVTLSGTLGLDISTAASGSTTLASVTVDGTTYGGGSVAAGVAVTGTGVALVVGGSQRIGGTFRFTQSGTGATRRVTLAVTSLSAFVGDDASTATLTDDTGVTLTGSGSLLITATGVAADFSATIAFKLPASLASTLSFGSGVPVRLQLNTMPAAAVDTGLSLNLPAGPFLRVLVGTPSSGTTAAQPLTVTIAGQQLSGVFSIEKSRTAGVDGVLGTTDDGTALRFAATDVALFVGDEHAAGTGDDVGVRLSNGTALLVLGSAGFAGRISASAELSLGSGPVASIATVALELNQRSTAVHEVFVVGSETRTLDLPAGPGYVRVSATGVVLTLGGFALTGDVTVTKRLTVTTIDLANVRVSIGSGDRPVVLVSNGHGSFTVPATGGLSGALAADVALDVPGVTLSGTFSVAFTNTPAVSGTPGTPASSTLTVSASNVVLEVAGQRLTGAFTVQKSGTDISLHLDHMSLRLGDGTQTFVTLTATGDLLVTAQGVAASFDVDVALSGPFAPSAQTAFSVTFTHAHLTLNTGKLAVNGIPAGPYLRIEAGTAGSPVEVVVLDQHLSGVFSLEQATTAGGSKVVKIGFSHLGLTLGSGDKTVNVTGGTGVLLLTPGGVAGQLSGTIGLSPSLASTLGFDASTQLAVQFSTVANPVKDTTTVDGQTIALDLPAGPFVRATATGTTVTIGGAGGVTLRADLYFESARTSGGLSVLRIGIAKGSIAVNGSKPGVSDISGLLVVVPGTSGGIAAVLSGKVAGATTGFSLGATISVKISTMTTPYKDSIVVNGTTVTVDVGKATDASTPYVEFSAEGLEFNFNDLVEIHGDFHITGGKFSATNLQVFVGSGPLMIGGARNPAAVGILITNAGVDFMSLGSGSDGLYALVVSGTVSLVGLDGLAVSGTVSLKINTATTDAVFTSPSPTMTVKAQTFSLLVSSFYVGIAGLLDVRGTLAVTRQPNGTLDLAIAGRQGAGGVQRHRGHLPRGVRRLLDLPAHRVPALRLQGRLVLAVPGSHHARRRSRRDVGEAGAVPDRQPGGAAGRQGRQLRHHLREDPGGVQRPERRRDQREHHHRHRRRVRGLGERQQGHQPHPGHPHQGRRPDQHLGVLLDRAAARRRGHRDPVRRRWVQRQERHRELRADRAVLRRLRAGRHRQARSGRGTGQPAQRPDRHGGLAQRPPLPRHHVHQPRRQPDQQGVDRGRRRRVHALRHRHRRRAARRRRRARHRRPAAAGQRSCGHRHDGDLPLLPEGQGQQEHRRPVQDRQHPGQLPRHRHQPGVDHQRPHGRGPRQERRRPHPVVHPRRVGARRDHRRRRAHPRPAHAAGPLDRHRRRRVRRRHAGAHHRAGRGPGLPRLRPAGRLDGGHLAGAGRLEGQGRPGRRAGHLRPRRGRPRPAQRQRAGRPDRQVGAAGRLPRGRRPERRDAHRRRRGVQLRPGPARGLRAAGAAADRQRQDRLPEPGRHRLAASVRPDGRPQRRRAHRRLRAARRCHAGPGDPRQRLQPGHRGAGLRPRAGGQRARRQRAHHVQRPDRQGHQPVRDPGAQGPPGRRPGPHRHLRDRGAHVHRHRLHRLRRRHAVPGQVDQRHDQRPAHRRRQEPRRQPQRRGHPRAADLHQRQGRLIPAHHRHAGRQDRRLRDADREGLPAEHRRLRQPGPGVLRLGRRRHPDRDPRAQRRGPQLRVPRRRHLRRATRLRGLPRGRRRHRRQLQVAGVPAGADRLDRHPVGRHRERPGQLRPGALRERHRDQGPLGPGVLRVGAGHPDRSRAAGPGPVPDHRPGRAVGPRQGHHVRRHHRRGPARRHPQAGLRLQGHRRP